MRHLTPLGAILWLAPAAAQVDTASLLAEAGDLGRLARLPSPAYDTIQWSSRDRRSRGPEDPEWFSNADGFGREPVPGFARVLRAPDERGIGLYLLGEHAGPGAIVRTWTAGMDGILRVYLDGGDAPVFAGRASDFLARRTPHFAAAAGLDEGSGAAFVQVDADYLPVAFERGLRITWEGDLRWLHFYHVNLRRYAEGTAVRTFSVDELRRAAGALHAANRALSAPPAKELEPPPFALEPGETWRHEFAPGEPNAIEWLQARVDGAGPARDRGLRGTLLRISFDGSQRPQVEAPLGDFFGSGPGINPFTSLPLEVLADGTLRCRFVMPFREHVRIELVNHTDLRVTGALGASVAPFEWDDATCYFRARWRVSHDLVTEGRARPMDMPYLLLRGSGRLVGAACMIVNPSPIPTPGGNWWGEGDERVFVDDDAVPSTFGTGSEDYFNYSWSRPDLFSHAYCGQPLDSGPGTAGYVSNHRFHVLDDIPFRRFLGFSMELWTHNPVAPLSYGRIVWCYARPGALDDHERPMPGDLVVPELPRRRPVAEGAARGATILPAAELEPRVGERAVEPSPFPLSMLGQVARVDAREGDALRLRLPIEGAGEYHLWLVAAHEPGGATVRATVDGRPLALGESGTEGGTEHDVRLRSAHNPLLRSVQLWSPPLAEGVHELELHCVEPGSIAVDYLWIRRHRVHIPGAVEAETMRIAARSDGLEIERQRLSGDFSAGEHLWVKATAPGQFVELAFRAPAGRHTLRAHVTGSHDYGEIALAVDGQERARIDTFRERVTPAGAVDLGILVVDAPRDVVLRVEVVGSNPAAAAPGTYFGIDCVALRSLW